MTTVVADARAGIMASDSLWTDDSAVGATRKVWRVRGDLVGFAGEVSAIMRALEWFRSGFDGADPGGPVKPRGHVHRQRDRARCPGNCEFFGHVRSDGSAGQARAGAVRG